MTLPSPLAAPARPLEQLIDVETPEQVLVSYTIAGIGSRAAAALLDFLFCMLGMLLIIVLVSLGQRVSGGAMKLSENWMILAFILADFFIVWGYYVLFEGLRDGQTPGKKRMGLRVVQDGGYSVTFAASAVRNLMRALDAQPGFIYGIGIISAVISKTGKRLGDIVAGTMVVQERMVQVTPPVVTARRGPPVAEAHSTLLTDDEFGLLERYISRRQALEPERRQQLASQLAARLRPRAPESADSDAAFLVKLFEHEASGRARGIAGRSDTGARREQHAIVAHGAERWSRFATVLADAQRRGLRAMGEDEVSGFVSQYRELATDLARLRTAARGRDIDALFYLSRLVAGGHNLFYRERTIGPRAALRFLFSDVPREVRRSVRPILISALLLFGPAAASYIAVVRDPSLAPQLLPAEMINRAETGAARERRGEGYLPQQMAEDRGAVMASFIMTNNIRVTFLAFALGITAGIGTAVTLVTNGASLGAGMGYFAAKHVLHLILAFVAPHGVLELSAIAIAGGGGVLVGSAILLPGALTRREALVLRGRRAIRLIAASSLLLVVAGLIEGNVSPSPLPIEAKFFISALTAVAMGIYLSLGREQRTSSTTSP